jgi:hypothetical protein
MSLRVRRRILLLAWVAGAAALLVSRHDGAMPITHGIRVSKTCPASAAPGAGVTCSFTVTNVGTDGVDNLVVTNTVGGVTSAPLDCHFPVTGDVTTSLGPAGSTSGGNPIDTCSGTVDETMPSSCSTNLADRVYALGDAADSSCTACVSAYDEWTISGYTCTPGPTSTVTPTFTPPPLPGGLFVSKDCDPGPFTQGTTVGCSFVVTNLGDNAVTGLAVIDEFPYPGGSFDGFPCSQIIGGIETTVTTLGPHHSATDTCFGTIHVIAPSCGSGTTSANDAVTATATDSVTSGEVAGSDASGFAIFECTATPTVTVTPTGTLTPPTSTPTVTQTFVTTTPVPTNTPTGTITPPTNTPTSTRTNTPTVTVTGTPPTVTPTRTSTRTPTPFMTTTPTQTALPVLCGGDFPVLVTGPNPVSLHVRASYGATPGGGTAPFSYFWNCAFDRLRPIFAPGVQNVFCTYHKVGSYVVEAEVRDAAGKRGFCGINLTVNDTPCAWCTTTPSLTPTRTPTGPTRTPTATRTRTFTVTPTRTVTPTPTSSPSVQTPGVQACDGTVPNLDGADVQSFTADGTWVKPPGGFHWVVVIGWGGGGGGGSGITAAGGGSAGGGAARKIYIYPITDLPSTVPVTVGSGGTGGQARPDGSSYNVIYDGAQGATSTFAAPTPVAFYGGGGGRTGSGSADSPNGGGGGGWDGAGYNSTGGCPSGTSGQGGLPNTSNACGRNGSGGEGANGLSGSSAPVTPVACAKCGGGGGGGGGPYAAAPHGDAAPGGGSQYGGGGGGGAGGGAWAGGGGPWQTNGGDGGRSDSYANGGALNFGSWYGNPGGAGASGVGQFGGFGGGGGGAGPDHDSAGNGGAGGAPGGAGGGGGSVYIGGAFSGAGGPGARGEVRVYCIP